MENEKVFIIGRLAEVLGDYNIAFTEISIPKTDYENLLISMKEFKNNGGFVYWQRD